jgi:hypothetical protein
MKDGISGGPVPAAREYATLFDAIAGELDISPLVLCAIRQNETSEGDPPNVVSDDGGHGIMQLTSSWPPDWADPEANIAYAAQRFVAPQWAAWVEATGLQGDGLIRAIAAGYNAGYETALRAHTRGDVDAVTTDRYGERALANYHRLLDELAEQKTDAIAGAIGEATIQGLRPATFDDRAAGE